MWRISNGIIFIYNILDKNKENILILLYKYQESYEFNKVILTLQKYANITNVIKKLKGKNIEEIIIKKLMKF